MRMNLVGKMAILLVCGLSAFGATTVYTDLTGFVSATGANSIANFDDLAVGTNSPFTSDNVYFSITNVVGIIDNAVTLSHSYWFGAQGSPPNWAGANTSFEPVTITFPSNTSAFGFVFTCFLCDSISDNTGMQWTLLSASDAVVGAGTTTFDFGPNFVPSDTNFLGVESTVPFQSVTVTRTNLSTGHSSPGTWFLDDVRYAPLAVPEPSAATLVALGIAALVISSRRRAL